MKYRGMPSGMWLLFRKPFRKSLVTDLGIEKDRAGMITRKAKQRYRKIIERLPEFEKQDWFKSNIVNCHLDYVMSELGGASNFVREYTLASGGPYCDCGYKKRN